MASMKIIRFHATADGGSRFQEIEIPIDQPRVDSFGNTLRQSAAFASPGVRFVELPRGLDQSWHNAPARQIVFVLSGVLEVGTTDGEARRWGPGAAFMPYDVSGKGHTTRVLEGPALVAFIQLPEGFDVERWAG
ncbi:MAG TPA: hypothetical protein VFB33_13690 [Candidatus Binataceae bacterium]|jgi:hypothetical protein|nr:hypothetical protein [Candidatus Binataceae bacterium]